MNPTSCSTVLWSAIERSDLLHCLPSESQSTPAVFLGQMVARVFISYRVAGKKLEVQPFTEKERQFPLAPCVYWGYDPLKLWDVAWTFCAMSGEKSSVGRVANEVAMQDDESMDKSNDEKVKASFILKQCWEGRNTENDDCRERSSKSGFSPINHKSNWSTLKCYTYEANITAQVVRALRQSWVSVRPSWLC